MEFWLVQGLKGFTIPRLVSLTFVNLKSTEKLYRSKKSTSPFEIINHKKLKAKQIDIERKIPKYTNLI